MTLVIVFLVVVAASYVYGSSIPGDGCGGKIPFVINPKLDDPDDPFPPCSLVLEKPGLVTEYNKQFPSIQFQLYKQSYNNAL